MDPKLELKIKMRQEISDNLVGLVDKLNNDEIDFAEEVINYKLIRIEGEMQTKVDLEKQDFYRHMSDVLEKLTSNDYFPSNADKIYL